MSILLGLPSRQDKPVPGATGAAEVASHILRLLPGVHCGTLCFWGVWFGRPHDNCHSIIGAEAEADCLVLHFNDEEILKVWHPQGWRIDAREFVINSASRVLWQWYWYGRPQAPGNLMSHEFIRQGGEVSFQSTFPIGQPGTPLAFSNLRCRFTDEEKHVSAKVIGSHILVESSTDEDDRQFCDAVEKIVVDLYGHRPDWLKFSPGNRYARGDAIFREFVCMARSVALRMMQRASRGKLSRAIVYRADVEGVERTYEIRAGRKRSFPRMSYGCMMSLGANRLWLS